MSNHDKTRRIATQASEIAMAAPQVIALRTAQMAMAGVNPSAQDQREFYQMSMEKMEAFSESWVAMTQQMMKVNQELMCMWVQAWNPYTASSAAFNRSSKKLESAALGVFTQGLAPVHQRVVSNAKRLSRS